MRNIVFIAIFAALAVALGLLFLSVPNLELVTATFFLAGYFLGRRNGITAAVLGEFTFSLLNPLGIASPPLMAAQIAGIMRRTAVPLPGDDFSWRDDAGFGRIGPDACLAEVAQVYKLTDITKT